MITKPTRKQGILIGMAAAVVAGVMGILHILGALQGVRYLGQEAVFRQRFRTDCGGASLRMIFDHYGIPSVYDSLLHDLQIGTSGTSMLRIQHLAEASGLSCSGWKLAPQDLKDIPLPAIIYLHHNHFAVLEAFTSSGDLIIRDPARGKVQMAPRRFMSIWSGEALLFLHSRAIQSRYRRWFVARPIDREETIP